MLKFHACIPYLQAEMIGGISFEETQVSLEKEIAFTV